MKLLVCLFLISVSVSLFAKDAVRLSEPVYSDDSVEVFGEKFAYNDDALNLSEIMKSPDAFLNKQVMMETSIVKVCQKKGCFFISQINDQVVRVSFKDYGFFIPTDTATKKVKVIGELVKTKVSKEKAAHLKEDLNIANNAIVAGDSYEFIASAIAISKS